MVTGFGTGAAAPAGPPGDSTRQLANLRDLGGLRLAGGGVTAAGVLYRSDAPYPGDAVPEQMPAWPPATVIDLRSSREAGTGYQWPAGVSVHQVSLMREAAVVTGARDGAAGPTLERLPSLGVLYLSMLEAVPHRLASLVDLAASSGGPALVHCAAGKDRTGVAVAVLLLAGGVEPADVVADYTITESRMSALLSRLRGLGRQLPVAVDPTSELLRAPAGAISVVVERLTGWPGGPRAWVEAHGGSAEAAERWRDRLAAGNGRSRPEARGRGR